MKLQYIIALLIILSNFSCKKFLEKKPNNLMAVPTNLADFQAILDNNSVTQNATAAAMGMIAADEYYITDALYNTLALDVRMSYLWQKDPFQGLTSAEWARYRVIYIANVVINNIDKTVVATQAEEQLKNNILAHALFVRGYSHYHMQEIFGKPYVPTTAATDLGIPLRMDAELSARTPRSTVKEVFAQILKDLKEAAPYLPRFTATINRPSRLAAFAMLSRIYLTMQDYQHAKDYADSALNISKALYDYNDITVTGTTRAFARFTSPNDFLEVLYPASQQGYTYLTGTAIYIDSTLLNSYAANDLRKNIFFVRNASAGNYYFRGQYSGISLYYNGPFMDELYLNRSEANVRLGKLDEAFRDMDSLLIKRYAKNQYIPYKTSDTKAALKYVLNERKKELVFRGLRWTDLRRLNQDPEHAITITRVISNKTYTLAPNSNNYTYPIPQEEMLLNPITQNERD